MTRLGYTDADSDIVAVNATTAPFPPVTAAAVPAGWGDVARGFVTGFDADLSAAASGAGITDVLLYEAEPEVGAIADTTFTTTHAANTMTDNAHGLITGDGPVRVSSAGTLPAGLAAGTDYWIIYVDANTYKLAASRADAFAGTAVDITDDGTGVHTLSDIATTELVKWRRVGVISSAPTISAREGVKVRCEHSPRAVAYGFVWTGTAANAIKAKICPVIER